MSLIKTERPSRNQIQDHHIKHWSRHWCVEQQHVEAAIEKAGNSVAAVQKELIFRGFIVKPND
jgi:hypothetical protein